MGGSSVVLKKLKYDKAVEDLIDMWTCDSCGRSFEEGKIRKEVDLGSYTLYLCKDCVMRVDYLIGDNKTVSK